MIGEVLTPLRARYAAWLELDDDQLVREAPEPRGDVRALPLILRMERDRPPSWHRALALAATASAAICLDPRAEASGEWHDAVRDYCAGPIRKVTRRARGAQWAATAELPGRTFADGDTQVRALVPGRVTELDPRVARLQVGGTDAPPDRPAGGPPSSGAVVLSIQLPPDVQMTLGKAMAQTGHAGMIAAALLAADQPRLRQWIDAGLAADARRADPVRWAGLQSAVTDSRRAWAVDRLLAVRDAGFTEVAPGTVTAIAGAGW